MLLLLLVFIGTLLLPVTVSLEVMCHFCLQMEGWLQMESWLSYCSQLASVVSHDLCVMLLGRGAECLIKFINGVLNNSTLWPRNGTCREVAGLVDDLTAFSGSP